MQAFGIYPDAERLTEAAAQHFLSCAQRAIETRGQFSVALSGGSTPRAMHKLLASQHGEEIAWRRVHFFWGDERAVPPEHKDSNFRMAKETLLDQINALENNIHRIKSENEPQAAAEEYEEELRGFFQTEWPRFDLVLLGMGADGHSASLFPDTEALKERERWVAANYVHKLESWRITLTAPAINAARRTTVIVAGENKAGTLREVLESPRRPEVFPSQLIQPRDGELLWLLDAAAASLLKRERGGGSA